MRLYISSIFLRILFWQAESCLSSIATVRSFAAEQKEADTCVECHQYA
jgi:hypothetical protein